MHALRSGAVPLLATMVMAACNDVGPTASFPGRGCNPGGTLEEELMMLACADTNAPPPPAVQLAFTTQPGSATAGVAIHPVVAVAIEDASGDLVPSATHVVTVALETNPGGGTLAGTTSVAAVQGVATFTDLRVDKAGAGYTLTAAAAGLIDAYTCPLPLPLPQLVRR